MHEYSSLMVNNVRQKNLDKAEDVWCMAVNATIIRHDVMAFSTRQSPSA